MDYWELNQILAATGEEIKDDEGNAIGYVAQPAKFKLNLPYLGLGGFLVVTRNEESLEYVGTLFDALPHPKTREPYPAGHSEVAWRTRSLDEACTYVLSYLSED